VPHEAVAYNEVGGPVTGMVVQAGAIHRMALSGAAPPEERLVPRQLPLAVRDFIGRVDQLTSLDAALATAQADGASAGAVVISAVDGLPGVGKTALAVYWAHQVQDRFPDGTLYVNLRGYGPGDPAQPSDVLDGFLRALGEQPERIPIGVESRAGLYRSLLAGRKVLVLLDNAGSVEQVRSLLPGSRGCLVLVTSRDSLTGLVINEGAVRVTLPPMATNEALELVRGTIGSSLARDDADAVQRLVQLCNGLPLALRISSGRIAARPQLRVGDMVREMVDDRQRLDTLSTSRDAAAGLRQVFDWSYEKLTAEQARIFRLLGLHPGPDVSLPAAAAVAGLTVPQTRRLLDELAEVHLTDLVAWDRYRQHDLLRAYAAERAEHDDLPEIRDRAVRTLLNWYVHSTRIADQILYPAYVRRFHDLAGPTEPVIDMNGRKEAETWLVSEQANVVAAIRYAVEQDLTSPAIALSHAIETHLYHGAYWGDLLEVCALGITAAERSNDRASVGWFLNRRGWARLQVSGWEDAVDDLHRALELARGLHDPYLEAYARNDLGTGCLRRERYAEALDYLSPAIPLSQGTDGGRQEAFVHCNVSSALAGLGDYDHALTHAQRSLRLRRQAGDREGEVFTRNQLAQVWQALGDHTKAIEACEGALGIPREYVYLPDVAAVLETLGASLLRVGDRRRAEECWMEASGIYQRFADHRAAALVSSLRSLGRPSSS
jgi:tetratricopeptide (TPR) repeat protein